MKSLSTFHSIFFILEKKKKMMEMKSLTFTFLSMFFVSLAVVSSTVVTPDSLGFAQCMSELLGADSLPIVCSLASCRRYSELLLSAQQNLRWVNKTISTPLYIVTPSQESHVQASVVCTRRSGLQIRVRSGGHDYEGLSYRSDGPFVLIDLVNLRSIWTNLEEGTAWVQTGATIGELYYEIAQKSSVHGFPAGICPSVGVGGHFSGGGIGTMVRKYGLAADQIINARIVDADGRVLDRRSMGEDLFWAIRGGGAASFGVVLSWKVKLVEVPTKVTAFNVSLSLDDPASIRLFQRWQSVSANLPPELYIVVDIWNTGVSAEIMFKSLFLGPTRDLFAVMDRSFPELGLKAENCTETTWIESVVYFLGSENPLEVLLDRVSSDKGWFKAKCDFVEKPIPEEGVRKIWKMIKEEYLGRVVLAPMGGRMNEISSSEIPYPHRKGVLYDLQYWVEWCRGRNVDCRNEGGERQLEWVRRIYDSMTPYVSKSPRAAYINYRDLDLGTNNGVNTSYEEASVWGKKYFGDNFDRLVEVKTRVDPENFFRNQQSIPSDVLFLNKKING